MLPENLEEARTYIDKLEAELRSKFQGRNRTIDKMRDLYFLEHHKGKTPAPGEQFITTNKATNIVDLGVGILSSNPMKIRVYRGVGETEESEESASSVERFLRACVYINNERYETDLEVEVITDQVRDGWAAVYGYWDPDAERDENNTYKELPIHLKVVEVKNLYWDEGGPRGKYRSFVYSCDRTVQSIEDEWGVELSGYERGEKKKQKVKYVDYWEWQNVPVEPVVEYEPVLDEFGDPVMGPNGVEMREVEHPQPSQWVLVNAVLADNQWVKEPEYMYGYDDIPYTVIPGRLTRSDDPGKRGLSILFPTAHQIEDLNRQLTHHRRLVNLYAGLQPVIETTDGAEPPNVDAVLGNPIVLRPGEKMYFPQWPGAPPDVDKALIYTRQEIQEGSFPTATYGEGPANSSGFAISLMNESGRTRLYQFQRNLERGWAAVFRKVISLAANFAPNDPLPAYGRLHGQAFYLPIVGGDMRGYRVDVEISPNFPQDQARKATIAAQINAQNLLSKQTIQEKYLDIEQPDEERKRMMYEMALTHPDMLKVAIQRALKDYAPEILQAQSQSEEQNQQATLQQNQQEQAMMGEPPSQRLPGELPPASIMPQEMIGRVPPQAEGGSPPGQNLPPDMIQLLNMLGGIIQ